MEHALYFSTGLESLESLVRCENPGNLPDLSLGNVNVVCNSAKVVEGGSCNDLPVGKWDG